MKTTVLIGIVAISLSYFQSGTRAESSSIHFNRDVRPILADKCFACHGPDEAGRKADLRLDLRDAAVADREGGLRAIVPGLPDESDIIHRILTSDAEDRMPPHDSGKTLTEREIEILKTWITDGAKWEGHWSLLAPKRPTLPESGQNPIDALVFSRLKEENLSPSVPANRETLLRRVSLDLTGLPPTLEEIDAFLADKSPEAWRTVVDRLFRSSRFGEQMAVAWLDAARYADTHGYFSDQERTMWPWRDWVIAAYNRNLPFDQFTIEQLAGDLLPNATLDQKIATGFHRNHTINNETGIIEEEFRIEYVADRVKTTASVWLGLSLECARCHDHKFDPISQHDYYRFFAFFNNVPERGLDGSHGNAAPFLQVPPSVVEKAREADLQRQRAEAETAFQSVAPELAAAQAVWEKSVTMSPPSAAVLHALKAAFSLEGTNENDGNLTGSVRRLNPVPSPGLIGEAVELKGGASIEIDGYDDLFDRDTPFSFGLWIIPKGEGTIFSKIDDANGLRGLDLQIRKGKAVVQLAHRWNDNAIQVATEKLISSHGWRHFLVTWDGSGKASGLKLFVDGNLQTLAVNVDHLTESIRTPQPIRLGRRQASASLDCQIDEVQLFDRALTEVEVESLFSRQLLNSVAAAPPESRTSPEAEKLRDFYLSHHASESLRLAWAKVSRLRLEANRLTNSHINVMVMEEAAKARETHLLLRGQYDQPGDLVTPGVPASLPDLPSGVSPDRLGLAKWLVSPENPLTARVVVNRLWQQLFGRGLVATPEDFGLQGEWPSHPELLDWLAVEFRESGWDLQHLLRQIVLSDTYQQSSDSTPAAHLRDPDNNLLARGPRFRLAAEQIRDQALAVSGLLVDRIGGPSVKPWQPEGLWKAVAYDGEVEYQPDTGDGLYRRSLYTYWKRQSPPPNLLAFDASARETCIIHRSRTNTPLQALVLMNDPTLIEAARHLAGRAIKAGGGDPAARLRQAFRLATSREPSVSETKTLLNLEAQQQAAFESFPGEAEKLLTVGSSPPDRSLDPLELATWTTITNVILSLDETITKR